MLDLSFALDLSNFSGAITAEWVQKQWERGFRHAILSVYDAAIFGQQYDTLASFGFTVDSYGYLNFPGGTYWSGVGAYDQVKRHIEHMGGRVVGMHWLDAEDGAAEASTPEQNIEFLMQAAHACDGVVNSGIYTRKLWWQACTEGSQAFAAFKLWDATNDKTPDLAAADYGGWHTPYMEQYAFDVSLDDGGAFAVKADLNIRGDVHAVVEANIEPGVATVTDHTELQLTVAALEATVALAARGIEGARVLSMEHDEHRAHILLELPWPLPASVAYVNRE